MRDIVVFAIVFGFLPFAFLRPWYGLLLFTWLAYMRAPDLTWGFARGIRFSLMVAMAMFVGWVLFDRRRFMVRDRRCTYMILMTIAVVISFFLAPVKAGSVTSKAVEFVKVIAIALFTTAQIDTKSRLRGIVWVMTLSFAFYGIKGGIAGLIVRDAEIIRGPGGLLLDNNDFSLAMVMNLPFLHYLAFTEDNRRLKLLLRTSFVLTIITIVLTESRGGFLAMAAVCGVMVWKSQYKMAGIGAGLLGGLLFLLFIPDSYKERIGSITTDTRSMDRSALGRLHAWGVALNMIAANPWFGVGFQNFVNSYDRYDTNPIEKDISRVAHNSYLQIWAESGSFAFLFFMMTIASTWFMARRLQRTVRVRDGPPWIGHYAAMVEVSLAGFIVGAMFLNRAHFDFLYQLVAVAVSLRLIGLTELYAKPPAGARSIRAQPGVVMVETRDPRFAGGTR
jgi:probable O-glycosylation ligase (exosortase A-associated)